MGLLSRSQPILRSRPGRSVRVLASVLMARESATAGTARWTAAARARESARPDRLFDDPWAAELAGPEGLAMMKAREPDDVPNPFLPIRTRFIDDVVLRHSDRVAQLVLLGAGYDTRAVRLPLPGTTTVFALDQLEVLHRAGKVITSARAARDDAPVWVPVPVDLADGWADALLAAGFDSLVPALWIAEGLLFYLTDDQVFTALSTAAELSSPSSALVADAFGTGLLDLPSMRSLVEHRAATGTPLPFCTDTPHALLRSSGWTAERVVEPGQADANFGRLPELPDDWHGGANPKLRTYFMVGRPH
jgi:methyltransferase (TIGR00027 family)